MSFDSVTFPAAAARAVRSERVIGIEAIRWRSLEGAEATQPVRPGSGPPEREIGEASDGPRSRR